MKQSTVEIALGAAGASVLTGSVLGLPAAALLAGFGGGIVTLTFQRITPEAMSPLRALWARAGALTASTLTAGFLGPYTAHYAHSDAVPPQVEMFAFSFLWGAGVQVLLPAALRAAKARIEQLGGIPQNDRKE